VSGTAPSLEHLRAVAALQGVHPSDEDLAAVQGFLGVLLPAFSELDTLSPPGTVPAAMFVPTDQP
jgi:hypothetical protein